jgi:cytochrome c peroxidase
MTRPCGLRSSGWWLWAALALPTGCGDGRVAGYTAPRDGSTGAASSTLTDLERASLRKDFGRLATEAPLDPTNLASSNPAAAKLGQALFFDARYSTDGKVSCSTCHIPEAGFQDNRANTSEGIAFTGRHAPSVFNAGFGPASGQPAVWQFWDGRVDSLWAQALGPPESSVEMGGTRCRIALLIYDHYRANYEATFPADSPMPKLRDEAGKALVPEEASPHAKGADLEAWQDLTRDDPALAHAITRVFVNFGKAIAAYESLLITRNSRFDQFRDAVMEGNYDGGHLSESELRGFKLFVGKAGCSSCHRGPNLTDGKFHNIGVAQTAPHVLEVDRGRADGLASVAKDEFNCLSEWSDVSDPNDCAVANLDLGDDAVHSALGAFKTPMLRSVSRTAPYFHTGSALSLLDVVNHYTAAGDEGHFEGDLDENIVGLDLTDREKQALVDFMGALDGEPLPNELTAAPEIRR